MPVTDITKDIDNRKIVITAEFAAPVERIWQVYADPRQLEKVWGPPSYPATVVEHTFEVGGRVHYYMTGPEGDKHAGWWKFTAIDPMTSFAFDDGFADLEFNPIDAMPVSHSTFRFEAHGDGTRATYEARYESAEALQKVLDMGMEQGATAAINQIDALVA